MTEGARVVRVSLRSDEGKIDERGTIRRRYNGDDGGARGFYVEWDATEATGARMGYVAPVRIVTIEEWQQHQQAKKEAA